MYKPASLRQALGAAIPALRIDPDKLLVFSDAGTVASTSTRSLSFEYRYQLNLILTDFAGEPDDIIVVLLAWAKTHQPDILDNVDRRANGITFEVDHLANDVCDLSIKMNLAEDVKVVTGTDGQHTITHPVETVPEWRLSGTLTAD